MIETSRCIIRLFCYHPRNQITYTKIDGRRLEVWLFRLKILSVVRNTTNMQHCIADITIVQCRTQVILLS